MIEETFPLTPARTSSLSELDPMSNESVRSSSPVPLTLIDEPASILTVLETSSSPERTEIPPIEDEKPVQITSTPPEPTVVINPIEQILQSNIEDSIEIE